MGDLFNSKVRILLILILPLLSCDNPNKEFNIDLNVKGNYTGYLYLITDHKVDSSIVDNGRASFSGAVEYPTKAGIITDTISGYDKEFYLENTAMQVDIEIIEKDHGNGPVDWIIIKNVEGTETAKLQADFEEFEKKFSNTENWNKKLSSRIKNLILEHPENRYPGDLLARFSEDSSLTKNQLTGLYERLNKSVQDPYSIKTLEQILYPEKILKEGDSIHHITGVNYLGEELSTSDFRGKLLLIDFWASWCKPCIDQFDDLKAILEEFRDENFMILGIALEDKKEIWKRSLSKYQLNWPNLYSEEKLSDEIAITYGIQFIPFNVLVDENGIILKKNIGLSELRRLLN